MKYLIFTLVFIASSCFSAPHGVRVKDMARIEGNREVALVGYGIVVGLSGTGDSARNKATLQSLANTLTRFGLNVDESDLNAKNVAAVMITAELPPYGEPGDRFDVRVASTGDARSLVGGTLLLSPLYGPDNKLYALSQGALTVGGYQVESFYNMTQKNHATVGQIADGGSIERTPPNFQDFSQKINIILKKPDYTTANRLVNQIKQNLQVTSVEASHPGKISVTIAEGTNTMSFISRLENLFVVPDLDARVVVNERTGTIVAGSNVTIGEVSIAHGNLRIEIVSTFEVSQPQLLFRPSENIETVVVPETDIKVSEDLVKPIQLPQGTTVGDLVQAMYKIKLTTRDTISILESIKAAGALHADLIIQ